MIYNLARQLDREKFKTRVNFLFSKGIKVQGEGGACVIELTERKPKRTTEQNSYLHLLISYCALAMGESAAYVKDEYYKRAANADLFYYKQYDEFLGREVERVRSSTELSTEEMSVSIDRFKTWAAQVAGIYLPDAQHPEEIVQAYQELDMSRRERL